MKIIVLYPLKWKTDPEQVICEAAAQKPDLIACIASPALELDNARKTLAKQYALVLHDELFRKWNKEVGNPKWNAVTGVFAADSLDFTEEERPGHRYFDNVIDRYLAISTEHGYIRADNVPHVVSKHNKDSSKADLKRKEYTEDVVSDMNRVIREDKNALFFGCYPSNLAAPISELSVQQHTGIDVFRVFASPQLTNHTHIKQLDLNIYEIEIDK